MGKFKSPGQVLRFLSYYGEIDLLFRLVLYLMQAINSRILCDRFFVKWSEMTCVQNWDCRVKSRFYSYDLDKITEPQSKINI